MKSLLSSMLVIAIVLAGIVCTLAVDHKPVVEKTAIQASVISSVGAIREQLSKVSVRTRDPVIAFTTPIYKKTIAIYENPEISDQVSYPLLS